MTFFEDPPERIYDDLLEQYSWAFYVLIYITSADGALKSGERKLIAEFCQLLRKNIELNSEKLDLMILGLGKPDKYTVHRYIRERIASDELKKQIYGTAKAIIALNKTPHTEQVRAINYIIKNWKPNLVL